jgi:hypothetical protein
MMTHWIIEIGRPKLPVMSGKAMLTALSSGTTETPNPIKTSRTKSPARELETNAVSDGICGASLSL